MAKRPCAVFQAHARQERYPQSVQSFAHWLFAAAQPQIPQILFRWAFQSSLFRFPYPTMHWGWPFVIAVDECFTLQNQTIELGFLPAFGTAYLWFYPTRAPSARIFPGRHSDDLAKYDTRIDHVR